MLASSSAGSHPEHAPGRDGVGPRRAHAGVLSRVLLVVALATLLVVALAPAAVGQEGDDDTEGEGAEASGESVTGDLLDADDEPVEGVELVVRLEGEEVGRGTSDAEGHWEVAVPGAGTYEVELDPDTLPEGVGLRDADRTVLDDVRVREGQAKRVVFAIGARAQGISDTEQLATLAFDGLHVGLVLAVMSVGLSLVFAVTGLTNFAHGEMVTFGALIAYLFSSSSSMDLPLLLAAALALVAGAGFGAASELALFRPLRRRRADSVALIVVTVGLSVVLRNLYLIIFGGRPRPYDEFTIQRGLDWPLISPLPKDLWVMGIAAFALAVYALALSRTRLGTATRAVADSRELAESSGIDVQVVLLTVWIGAGVMAALGGVLWGTTENIVWDMGFTLLLLMFATSVLGGIGSAYGPIVGGIVIGVTAQVSTFWVDSKFRIGVALAILIVTILFRPQGILGRRERIG
jgi:neutral amino acid transport system permease protein